LFTEGTKDIFLSYFLMAFLAIIIFCVAFIYRRKYAVIKKIGFISWISLIIYFIIEYFVIRATTIPYDYLVQPMRDLCVTIFCFYYFMFLAIFSCLCMFM